MKVAFRVDASLQIGTGHVMRCFTLAEGLRENGSECRFICREHQGNLIDFVREKGFETVTLTNNEIITQQDTVDISSSSEHRTWLGCDWQTDAEQTSSTLEVTYPDWLVVDHYALDVDWEMKLRPYCKRIMVIDDMADRMHECDLLLDQNFVEDMESRYLDKVPEACTLLLGLDYALLQPVYAEMHRSVQARKTVKRILIYFGGADQSNLTASAISAILQLNRPDIEVDVVTSSKNPQLGAIQKQILNIDNIQLHCDLPTLAYLMLNADLAVGAGGFTNWERLSLGLPALVVTLAENQRLVASNLNNLGLIKWIGNVDEVDTQKIMSELKRILEMTDVTEWSNRCLKVCAGNGLSKVVDELSAQR